MKILSRFFGVFAITAAALSCTKENDIAGEDRPAPAEGTPQEEVSDTPASPVDLSNYDPSVYLLGIGAEFEGFTKADFEFNESGNKGKVTFESDDAVLVYVPSSESTGTYQWNGEDLFTPATEGDAIAIGDNEAFVYYPASEFEIVSGTVKFTVPAAIAAGSTKDLGSKSPMIGHIASGAEKDASGRAQVVFKNLGAILRVGFHSPEGITRGETITKVKLTSNGKSITGTGSVGWDAVNNIPTLTDLENGTESITIEDIEDGGLIPDSDRVFYFFLPVNANSEDALGALEVKAIYGKTVGEVIYEPYETITRGALVPARNTIYSLSKPLAGFFSGGDGSEDHPYIIANASDFDQIYANWDHSEPNDNIGYNGTDTFFGHANYKQTVESIDFTSKTYNVIGTSGKPFYGVYDGNKNVIANVTLGNGNNLGLFGYISGATITQVKANSISVTGTGSARGAIVGYMNGGVVSICEVTGNSSVSGNQAAIGGIVGRIQGASGMVASCTSSADVVNTASSASNLATGGIVGLIYTGADNSEIISCSTSGNISGGVNASCIGGIVGRFYAPGNITACSTSLEKTVSGVSNVGGIAGQMIAGVIVSGCTNNAAVSGVSSVGGLVGLMTNGSIKNDTSYNKGAVTASGKDSENFAAVGGIAGKMEAGSISSASNAGNVTAGTGNGCGGVVGAMTGGTITGIGRTEGGISGIHHTGGIVGILQGGKVEKCYNNLAVVATGNGVGGIVGTMQGGSVTTCYSKASIKIQGTYRVGGIVGYLSSSKGAAVVINCASKSNVGATNATSGTSNGYAGGIVGQLTSSSGKNAVLANCVALAAKIYGVVNNIPCGGVVGLISGVKDNSIVDNCYSQANNATSIGFSSDNGSNVTNCDQYSGGVYGYLSKGSVMDCYYTTSAPKSGNRDGNNSALYGSEIKEITNNAKNGTENVSITSIGAYYENHFYSVSVPKSATLYQILNTGVQAITKNGEQYSLSATVNQKYESSSGEEECSDWTQIVSSSAYKIAYPKTLYDLGANYRP